MGKGGRVKVRVAGKGDGKERKGKVEAAED